MSWKNESKREQQITPWIIGAAAVIVVGIATYMNYGSSIFSHAAPAATTVAPDTK